MPWDKEALIKTVAQGVAEGREGVVFLKNPPQHIGGMEGLTREEKRLEVCTTSSMSSNYTFPLATSMRIRKGHLYLFSGVWPFRSQIAMFPSGSWTSAVIQEVPGEDLESTC